MNTTNPRHIAIVMDGNNRWAAKRGFASLEGHKAGVGALKDVVKACVARDIDVLTVFAFSSENWNRPPQEVEALMGLFFDSLEKELDELRDNGVQLRFIGDLNGFSPALRHKMMAARESTSANSCLVLNVAVNYGGRWEVIHAAQKLMRLSREGALAAEDLSEDVFHKMTCLGELPPVDLFIRTGDEVRVSNFLLWHLAYAEMVFSPVMWPDFSENELVRALESFKGRQRRFGKTGQQILAQMEGVDPQAVEHDPA